MEKEYIQVSFENGNIERKSYPAGIRLLDLAKEYQKEDDIVLAKVNGRLRELYLQLTEDCRILSQQGSRKGWRPTGGV